MVRALCLSIRFSCSHLFNLLLDEFMLHLGHILIHFICMLLQFNLGTYSYKKVGKVSQIISEVSVENYAKLQCKVERGFRQQDQTMHIQHGPQPSFRSSRVPLLRLFCHTSFHLVPSILCFLHFTSATGPALSRQGRDTGLDDF